MRHPVACGSRTSTGGFRSPWGAAPVTTRNHALLSLTVPAAAAVAAILVGCVLVAGELQSLVLTFATQRTVEVGETLEIHSAVYPEKVELRGVLVRVAGRLIVAEGAALPASVDVAAVNQDVDSGRVRFRFKLSVEVAEDGTFSAIKRYRKDIAAGTLQTVSVTPRGAAIPNGSQITVCVDLARSAEALSGLSCPAQDPSSGGQGNLFVVKVLDNSFEPRRLRVEPGDTVRWVLEGSATDHTTTEMEMRWDSGFAFTQTGSFFEWTPTEAHRDQTFGYSCVTHRTCCAMTGSIQVGANAPDPGDGY